MTNFLSRVSLNWKSGLTVALVSIPLSLSLAIASGASPIMGIITAIWAGLVASLFGGSHFNIVGPAGALSGILGAYVLTHGVTSLPVLALITGGFILLAYIFRLERFLVFVPASTLHGFTLGVAVIIALNQLNAAFGLTGLTNHPHFIENVFESLKNLGNLSVPTALVFFLFLAGLFVLARLLPRLPGVVVLAPVGILLGYLAKSGIISFPIQTLGERFGDLKASLIMLPEFSFSLSLVPTALVVAFIAILETMISAKIADGMTKSRYHERKEMLGLGLANLASGLFGGLPATGVLVRTSLNVKTGATHSISAGLNAVFVALISLLFIRYFNFIPMAIIAAILVFTSIRMVEREHFIRFFHHERAGFFIALLVAIISVYKDPIYGILFGVVAALLVFMERLSRGQYEVTANAKGKGFLEAVDGDERRFSAQDYDVLLYTFKGSLVYVNGQAHISRFRSGFNGYEAVIFRLNRISFIDVDGIDVLDDMIEHVESQGKIVYLVVDNEPIEAQLRSTSDHYHRLMKENRIFQKTRFALEALGVPLKH